MSYSIDFTQKKDFLHATAIGKNTETNMAKVLEEVGKACVERECRRVLIETNMSGPSLNDISVFYVIRNAINPVTLGLEKVAFVDKNPEHDFATAKFGESVAVNRGVRGRVFLTVEEAEQWLMGENHFT